MSLPIAPLGQLSGLNLPYSIPTYEKPKSILQQALAAALVNIASTAGKNVAENVTSRDFATEADGGPAKGFSRLLGPKVNRQQAEARDSRNFQSAESGKSREFLASQAEIDRDTRAMEDLVKTKNAQLAQESQNTFTLDRDYLNDRNAQALQGQSIDAAKAAEQARHEQALLLKQIEAQINSGMPSGQLQSEQARQLRMINDQAEKLYNVKPQQPQVDPKLLEHKKGGKIQTPVVQEENFDVGPLFGPGGSYTEPTGAEKPIRSLEDFITPPTPSPSVPAGKPALSDASAMDILTGGPEYGTIATLMELVRRGTNAAPIALDSTLNAADNTAVNLFGAKPGFFHSPKKKASN